jgi:nucleoside-diphosphate-sugar epimerase
VAAGDDATLTSRNVLLAGASSQIGLFALPRLQAAGFRVTALSRRGRPAAVPAVNDVEWVRPREAVAAAAPCQYLLSAGPLSLARSLLDDMRELQTAAVFSSSSVCTKQASADAAERFQAGQMLECETAIGSSAERRGVKLVIFRPTLVYGCGLDSNITRLANWIRRYGFMPVNGPAEGLRQPVHADDLAAAAVAALTTEVELPRVLPLAGGSTLSYADMVRKIFAALGMKERLLRLPQWLMITLLSLARATGQAGGTNAEMVRRQRRDLVFDDHEARELLGYQPRAFGPAAADLALPQFSESRDCGT